MDLIGEYAWIVIHFLLLCFGLSAFILLLIGIYLKWLLGDVLFFDGKPETTITMSSHCFCIGDKLSIFPSQKGNYLVTSVGNFSIGVVACSVREVIKIKFQQLTLKF